MAGVWPGCGWVLAVALQWCAAKRWRGQQGPGVSGGGPASAGAVRPSSAAVATARRCGCGSWCPAQVMSAPVPRWRGATDAGGAGVRGAVLQSARVEAQAGLGRVVMVGGGRDRRHPPGPSVRSRCPRQPGGASIRRSHVAHRRLWGTVRESCRNDAAPKVRNAMPHPDPNGPAGTRVWDLVRPRPARARRREGPAGPVADGNDRPGVLRCR